MRGILGFIFSVNQANSAIYQNLHSLGALSGEKQNGGRAPAVEINL
jgi:hypothetical protein